MGLGWAEYCVRSICYDGSMMDSMTDSLHAELAAHLETMAGEGPSARATDAYRVERVLKESPAGPTQLVWFRGMDGSEIGPLVRKYLALDAGLGGAYRELAQAQRAGRHFRHLPRIVDCSEEASRLVVVAEYVPGPTLREVVASTPADQRAALAGRFMPGLCEAVAELHESFATPIIHRDLTPGNVVCPNADPLTPVLIDLGIARIWHEGAMADTTHFGTRAYAPPEQYGFGQTDVRSDVYALGLIAFFCLAGRDPTPADRALDFTAMGVPEAWRRIIARAAAYDPSLRYASARELGDAFRALGQASDGPAAVLGARQGQPASMELVDGPQANSGQVTTPAVANHRPLSTVRRAFAAHRRAGAPRLWSVRNVVICVVEVVFLAACVAAATRPHPSTNDYPVWYNLYGFLVFMPTNMIVPGYLLMDKRWLRTHVDFFRIRSPQQARKPAFVALGLIWVLFLVMVAAVGT